MGSDPITKSLPEDSPKSRSNVNRLAGSWTEHLGRGSQTIGNQRDLFECDVARDHGRLLVW